MSIEQFSKKAQAEADTLFPIETLKNVFDWMQKTNYYNNLIVEYWKRNTKELKQRREKNG